MLIISPLVKLEIEKHALLAFPKECCGLIVDDGYFPYPNLAPNPEEDFELPIEVWSNWEGKGIIKAVVHSHPNAPTRPSARDMQSQIDTNVPWVIVSTDGTLVTQPVIFGDPEAVSDLIGRPFLHGVTDCYSLIRDYYKIKLAKEIPEFPRNDEWWLQDQDLYTTGFEKAGFVEIPKHEVKVHDVFMITIRAKVINHAGILVEDELFLHHLPNRASRREPAGIWASHVDRWVRHKDFM